MRRAILILFLLLSAAGLASAIGVSSCQLIDSSGSYQLTNNLVGAPIDAYDITGGTMACIKITSSDVELDCAGYSMRDNSSGDTTGIIVGGSVSNVTIRDCDIRDYSGGFYSYQVTGGLFTNNTIYNATAVTGRDGMFASYTDDSVFSDNVIGMSGYYSFQIQYSSGNMISGNDISGYYGASITYSCNNNNFTGNIIHDTAGDGLLLSTNSGSNTVQDNVMHNNTDNGLDFWSGANNNLAINNTIYDDGSGVYLYNNFGNSFINNSACGNNYGFLPSSFSHNNVFTDNTACNNTYDGFYLYNTRYNSLTGNSVYGNRNKGFNLETGTGNSMADNVVYGNLQDGVYIHQSAAVTMVHDHLYRNGPDFTVQYDYGVSNPTVSLYGVVFDNPAGDFTNFTNLSMWDSVAAGSAYSINWSAQPAAPPPAARPFAQKYAGITKWWGSVSIDSITWQWNDTEVSDGGYNESGFSLIKYTGMWSRLPGAVLDTGAHTLTVYSLDPASVYGIMEVNDTTAPAVSANSPDDGYTFVTPVAYFNITATDDASTTLTCGLYINGALVQVNSSVLNDTPTVFEVDRLHNGVYTWHVTCADGAANIGSSDNRGFTMDHPSACAIIDSPGTVTLAYDADGAPFDVLGGKACIVISSSDVLFDCNGYNVTNDGTPTAYGIVINGPLSNVTVRNCPSVSGYDYGVYAYQSTGSVLSNITAQNNNQHGFYVYSGSGNVLTGDTAYQNNNGFYLETSSGNNLTGDTAKSNFNTGYYLASSNYTSLTGDLVNDTSHGFNIITSYGNNLSGDTAYMTGTAVYIDHGGDNRLDRNTWHNNGNGVQIYDSGPSTLSGEHFYGNTHSFWFGEDTSSAPITYDATGIVFDSPSGAYQNYTNISMSDSALGEGYSITWSGEPGDLPAGARSFEGKYLSFSTYWGSPRIDSITWRWTPSEVSGGGYDESILGLYKYYSSADWSIRNITPDLSGHTLGYSGLAPDGYFGILEYIPPTPCPAPITSPGSYQLENDTFGAQNPTLLSGGYACVYITASDVLFDCKGHSLANDGTSNSYGILLYGPLSNVTVRNCPGVSGYDYGAYMYNSSNSAFGNITANYSGNTGFYLDSSSGNLLSGDSAHDSGFGFYLHSGSGNTLSSDEAHNTWNAGTMILDSDLTTLSGVHYYANNLDLSVGEDTGGTITYDATDMIFDNPAAGYQNFTNLSISDSLSNEGYYAFWSGQPSAIPPGARSFEQKYVGIFTNWGSPSIDGITWHYNGSEASGYNESILGLYGYDWTRWAAVNITPDLANHELGYSGLVPNGIFGILEYVPPAPCPAPITAPGYYQMNESVGGSSNPADPVGGYACVVIAAPDVVFNCDGFNITDDGAHAIGIFLNDSATNVTVKNCPGIQGYGFGFYLYNAGNNLLMNDTVNGSPYYGFYLTNSPGNSLVGDQALDCNNGPWNGNGFYLASGSSYNNLTNNTASGSGYSGFYVDSDTEGNVLADSTAANNYGEGFYISWNSNNDALTGNTAYGSDTGFYLYAPQYANVSGNKAYGNSNGFMLYNTQNANVSDNQAYNNTGNGFNLNYGGSGSFENNSAHNNPVGFNMYSTNGNNLSGDSVYDNSQQGVYLQDSDSNMLQNEHLYNNSPDMRLEEAPGNIVNMSGMIFDSPSGTYSDYTNLSINGYVYSYSAYSIAWSAEPGTAPPYGSFRQKFVDITPAYGSPTIDSINWSWTDTDASGYDESSFRLYQFDGAGWSDTGAALDEDANTLSLSGFTPASTYGILGNTTGGGGNISVSLDSPVDGYNASKRAITFDCSANSSVDLSHITLYGNFTGSWQANQTNGVSGMSASTEFTLNLSYAQYSWNCLAFDTDGNSAWAPANFTFTADSLPRASDFGGSTTDFNNELDLQNVSAPILENTTYGILQWNNSGLDVAGADFDSNVLFGRGWVSVDSSNLSSTLNSPANITLYNLPNEYMPILYSDGAACSDCEILSYLGHDFSFTVQHFTNYSAGPNSNLTIYDQYEGSNVSKLTPITFYANYTNVTDGSYIPGATCIIAFDDGSSGTMVDTGTQYNYTKASGFPTTGVHLWNVTCNQTGFETLFAQDGVDVGPLNLTGNMTSLYQATVNASVALPRYVYNDSSNISSEGGNISGVDVSTEQLTDRWAAFYGNISGSIMLTDKAGANDVYQWGWTPASGGVVCTSTNSSVTDLMLYPADGDDIDAAWSFAPTEVDSGRNTFNQTGCSLTIGTTPITNAGYADTGQAGGFITCSLKDTINAAKKDMFFCTNITQNGVFWNNQVGDFELMVPTAFGNNQYETYYFYVNLD